jgi:hypothetical protein
LVIQICKNTKRIAHLTGDQIQCQTRASSRLEATRGNPMFGSDYCNMEPPCHYCNQGMFVVIGNVMQNMKQEILYSTARSGAQCRQE